MAMRNVRSVKNNFKVRKDEIHRNHREQLQEKIRPAEEKEAKRLRRLE